MNPFEIRKLDYAFIANLVKKVKSLEPFDLMIVEDLKTLRYYLFGYILPNYYIHTLMSILEVGI